jgi:hypothetical protein
MTESKITPRIVDNEPVCSGTECPAYCENDAHDGGWCRALFVGRDYMGAESGATCITGLRRERDAARRGMCMLKSYHCCGTVADHAVSYGWSYLYEEKSSSFQNENHCEEV